MGIREAMHGLLALYPRVFLACHREHRRHPRTGRKVSHQQAMILDHLDEFEPLSVSRLARHLGVTPSTMSLNLDRLERNRLVHRQRDGADARRVLVTLSAAGARVKDDQQVLDPQCVRRLLSALTPEQRETAITGLRLLAQAADEMRESSTGPRPTRPVGSRPGS